MGGFYDHPNKHIAHEVYECVTNSQGRIEGDVLEEHIPQFRYVTMREAVSKETPCKSTTSHGTNKGMFIDVPRTWKGEGRERLEDIFVWDRVENDQSSLHLSFHTMPNTLHLVFNRTIVTDELDESGKHKSVQITRPMDVPHKIDFNTGSLSQMVHPTRRKECAKKYKLAGAVVGMLANRDSDNKNTLCWWGYVYNPVEGQWYGIVQGREHPMHVGTADVYKHCNGVEKNGTPTHTFPLHLYYHEERDLTAVFASAPAPNSDEKFFNYAQLLGHTKMPAILRQVKPPVMTGRAAFDAYYTRILADHCESESVDLVTCEDLHALLGWVEHMWQTMDLRERCKWINNACRINSKVPNLTKFNGMTARELFKEQWILTMISCSPNAVPADNGEAMQRKQSVSDRVHWLEEEAYFADLWNMMAPNHKGIFMKLTKERNCCRGGNITTEQGMLEVWQTYKKPLEAFLIPGGWDWKRDGAELLESSTATRADLRAFFIAPLPLWKKRMQERSAIEQLQPEFVAEIRKICTEEGGSGDINDVVFQAAKKACEAISAQPKASEVTVEAPETHRKLVRACIPVKRKKDEQRQWFLYRCFGCREMRQVCITRPAHGEKVDAWCIECETATGITVPDQETVDANQTLTNYALVIRARLELKRLKREAWEREDAKREAGRAAARAAQREAQRQAEEARAKAEAERRRAEHEKWSREQDAKLAEEKRIFEERAAKAKAEHEAREAERIAKAREARTKAAQKKAAAEEAKKKEEQLAEVARLEKARAERAAREAAKADEKQKKKAAREKAANIFKEEEERQKRYSAEVAQQEADAKKAAKAKEAAERAAAEEERERKRAIQAEEEAKTAAAEARAAARAAVRQAERKYERSCDWFEANNQVYVELSADSAIDREAEWLLKEAIATIAAEKVATEAAVIVVEAAAAAAAADSPALLSPPSSSSSSSSSSCGPPQDWVAAATKVQDTMREVAEAELSLREAEDTAKAIKASLESAGMSPPAPKPAPAKPQWQQALKKKQQPAPKPKPEPKPKPAWWPPEVVQHHDEAPSSAPIKGTHYVRGKRVCWYFGRGKCRNGDACRYLHIREDGEEEKEEDPAPKPPEPPEPPEPKSKGKAKAKAEPKPEPEPEPDSTVNCVICFDGPKDHLCMPCKHLCVCAKCSEVVQRFQACPICREPIVDIFKVFA